MKLRIKVHYLDDLGIPPQYFRPPAHKLHCKRFHPDRLLIFENDHTLTQSVTIPSGIRLNQLFIDLLVERSVDRFLSRFRL